MMEGFTINKKPVAIFCDFDGTITEHDVIVMIMKAFAPPQWRDIVHGIMDDKTITIADGLHQLFALLPSSLKPQIETYVTEHVRFRQGFPAFVDFCEAQQIALEVVSGGVDFFIQPLLKPLEKDLPVFCNTAQFDSDVITVDCPYEPKDCELCNQCACCKIAIMDRFPADQYIRIAIGDSVTDVGMSRQADIVFARDRLLKETQALNIASIEFETFDDIQAHLKHLSQQQALPC